MTSRAQQLEHDVQAIFNAFVQDHGGRAPRMVELPPADWTLLRDYIQMIREAEGFEMSTVDVAKTDGRANFRLFGLPIVAGAADLVAPQAIAEARDA